MDSLRHRRTPSSERFFGIFSTPPSDSSPSAAAAASAAGVELNEAEVLWTSPVDVPKLSPRATATPIQTSGTFHSPSHRTTALHRPMDRNFGILAALPEDRSSDLVTVPPILQRKSSISSTSSSTSDSPSSSSSSSSSSTAARMIPPIPKPKPEYSLSIPEARMRQAQSLPVDVPVPPRRARRFDFELKASDVPDPEDGQEMMPPHEIVARTYGRGSPTTTFSVLEGAGRTLKGRDLRRVRDAVFRQTGFLD